MVDQATGARIDDDVGLRDQPVARAIAVNPDDGALSGVEKCEQGAVVVPVPPRPPATKPIAVPMTQP